MARNDQPYAGKICRVGGRENPLAAGMNLLLEPESVASGIEGGGRLMANKNSNKRTGRTGAAAGAAPPQTRFSAPFRA
jgi:hypothetical protein